MARRSVLFSPGDQPDLMYKAPETGADVVVFDLEDAVAPERKAEAREAVNDVLCDPSFDPDCEVCVRLNPPPTAEDDLQTILEGRPRIDSVMVPKAESASDVRAVDTLIDEHGFELSLIALCESAAGVLHAEEIATEPATNAVAFGAEDLSADIGATRTKSGEEVSYARQHVVLAASAAEVDAIDTLFTEITDTDGLAEDTAFARRLGYDGKIAIHPAQIPVINDAFTPTDDDVEWAKNVLAAKERADAEGRGVFRVDDEMIDSPLILRAERVIERYRAAQDE